MAGISHKPKHTRSDVSKGLKTQDDIVPEGGDNKAGLIRSLSAITHGEALGHRMWIDEHFLSQVSSAVSASDDGVKMRFTHPGLSSDGMGKFLGRAKGAVVDGGKVRVDAHFSKSAEKTPDGNLSEYVMLMAAEDPDMFGTSIVFDRDFDAEDLFREAHTTVETFTDPETNEDYTRRTFASPDPQNTKNLRHARLESLQAVDIVDQPAANPDGLFHRKVEFAQEGVALMDYLTGSRTEAPKLTSLGLDADRASEFLTRYLNENGLEIVPAEEESMSESTETKPAETDDAPDTTLSDERKRVVELSTVFSGEWLTKAIEEGQSLSEAKAAAFDAVTEKNAELQTRLDALESEAAEDDDDVQFAEEDDDLDEGEGEDDESLAKADAKQLWKKSSDLRAEYGTFETFWQVHKYEAA